MIINTIEEIKKECKKAGLNLKFGTKRSDSTLRIKGEYENRIKVRYFLKYKLNLVCLNRNAEKLGITAVIGIG